MESKRWDEFRRDLRDLWQRIREQHPDPNEVDRCFESLKQTYPELSVEIKEEDEVMEEGESKEKTKPRKKKRMKKSKEDIKKILVLSIKNIDAFKDYSDIDIKTDTERDCIETLSLLDKALVDARKRIIYFSSLQGQVLQALKDVTKCTMNELFKKSKYSPSHIHFLIRLHKLVLDNNKLCHSDLPLSFFKENIATIKKICEEERHLFKQV